MSSSRTVIQAAGAPAAIGPYSHAVRAGDLIFLSGQIAIDPATGELVGGGDAAAEARQVLANMARVLEAAGASPAQVVKTTIFLTDMNDFAAVNQVYGDVFPDAPPARSTVEVRRLPRGARVEIEAIAVVA
ncbi:MAG TPA: Rid family detoxifying hydrolase [Kofleriaceae bacterium]|nr:Rid family detoxifying hydrolase [Kofleriaceae bacterium]